LSATPAGTHFGNGPQRARLSKIPKM
jgi:hypothetical protein